MNRNWYEPGLSEYMGLTLLVDASLAFFVWALLVATDLSRVFLGGFMTMIVINFLMHLRIYATFWSKEKGGSTTTTKSNRRI